MATAESFLREAASEVGYRESGDNRTKFAAEAGHANGQPWCATYIVAMARRVALSLPSESAYTPTMANGFKTHNRWVTDSPQPGDCVFFDFPDTSHRIQHVGIVEKVNPDGTLQTIEGNTSSGMEGSQHNGGGVYRRDRQRRYVVGFGRPRFEPSRPPQGDDEMTADEREAVLTANHFVKMVWPGYATKIDQIHQHLEVLMKGVPAMNIPPVPKVVFEIAEKHGIDV